jgi:hypothetical protein
MSVIRARTISQRLWFPLTLSTYPDSESPLWQAWVRETMGIVEGNTGQGVWKACFQARCGARLRFLSLAWRLSTVSYKSLSLANPRCLQSMNT